MEPTLVHQVIATIHDNPPLRYWTGEGDLTLPDGTYTGIGFVALSASEESTEAPSSRLQISIHVGDPPGASATLRQQLLSIRQRINEGFGFEDITIRHIISNDHGRTWQIIPWRFFGKLSNSQITDGLWTVEIETFKGDADRGRTLLWSDSTQLARFPGDKGMNFTRKISQGVPTEWPFSTSN